MEGKIFQMNYGESRNMLYTYIVLINFSQQTVPYIIQNDDNLFRALPYAISLILIVKLEANNTSSLNNVMPNFNTIGFTKTQLRQWPSINFLK